MAFILLKFYRNKRLADFQRGAADFYRRHLKAHLAPNILARVKKHFQECYILILISGSVRYLLEPVVNDLGFDHLMCTDLQTGPDGLLTGKAQGPLCIDRTKRFLAEKLAEDINLHLESSYAYGNHQPDLPLLDLVGHPLVVEPTEPLTRHLSAFFAEKISGRQVSRR